MAAGQSGSSRNAGASEAPFKVRAYNFIMGAKRDIFFICVASLGLGMVVRNELIKNGYLKSPIQHQKVAPRVEREFGKSRRSHQDDN